MGKARNESVRTICLCSLAGEKSPLRNVAKAIDRVALAGLLGRFSGCGRLRRLRPVDLHLSAIGKTVAQLQVNQALVGDASFLGHAIEVVHHILGQSKLSDIVDSLLVHLEQARFRTKPNRGNRKGHAENCQNSKCVHHVSGQCPAKGAVARRKYSCTEE